MLPTRGAPTAHARVIAQDDRVDKIARAYIIPFANRSTKLKRID